MKFISGAIVIFSGCMLWASGSIGASLSIINSAPHHNAAEFATWGGFGVVLAGFAVIVLALISRAGDGDLR